MPSTHPTLAARLTFLCTVAGLGFEEVDKLAGLKSYGHTAAIARGDKPHPAATTATKFARLFNCDASWLVDGLGNAPGERRVRAAVRRAKSEGGGVHTPKATRGAMAGKRNARTGPSKDRSFRSAGAT